MPAKPRLLVFSDLDGTLLDHHNYDWSPARPALDALARIGVGVVLASSKTAHEIVGLRADMGLEAWPAIVENGAGRLAPYATATRHAIEFDALRVILAHMPDNFRADFVGFDTMSAEDVSGITGLSPDAAVLAQKRAYSIPGLWHGSAADKATFLAHLANLGVHAQQGGRFLTLSFGATKADQMQALCREIKPDVTIALGDAPNDAEMLENSDFGVVIANPNRDPMSKLKGEAEGRVTRSTQAGPEGWNTEMLALLARLELI